MEPRGTSASISHYNLSVAIFCETDRLVLRRLEPERDAGFMLRLLNDPDYLRNIGDCGVRSLADAERYIESGPLAMWEKHGYAICRVDLREEGTGVGLCGLLRRDVLDAPDVGFAFFPEYRGRGFAAEAGSAAIRTGISRFGMRRIVAIVSRHNGASSRVLAKLGLVKESHITLPGEDEELDLYALSVTDGSIDRRAP